MSSEELSNVSAVTLAKPGKPAVVEQTLLLIRKIFNSQLVELLFFEDSAFDRVFADHNLASAFLINEEGEAIGLIILRDIPATELGEKEQEILHLLAKGLVEQLARVQESDLLYKKQQQNEKELQQYKAELESAYEDLNLAHEELNEAFNTTILLSRNLSRSRTKINSFIEQAPIALGILRHRSLKIQVANKLMLDLWGKDKTIIGKPLAIGIPELEGQPFLEILDKVYCTGERYVGRAVKAVLYKAGQKTDVYFNFIYEPLKNESGVTNAIMIIATDVSEVTNRRSESLIEARNQSKT